MSIISNSRYPILVAGVQNTELGLKIGVPWHIGCGHYYNYTDQELQPILNIINSFNTNLDCNIPEGAASLVLVSGVSPEGAVDRHSDVSPDGATVQVHVTNFVNRLYSNVVDVSHGEAIQLVPSHKTYSYKYWWSQELDILKESSIASDNIRKAAGKPLSDRIYQNRNDDRNEYRKKY